MSSENLHLLVLVPCSWFIFLVLMASSVVINALQFIAVCVGAQRLSQKLATEWYSLHVFLVEIWSGVKMYITGTPLPGSTRSQIPAECALLIGNHSPGVDYLPGVCLSHRSVGCGSVIALMKTSLLLVPGIGITNWLQGSIFLRRNWKHDRELLGNRLDLLDHGHMPRPYWIGLFPEGTRISPKTKAKSIEFSIKNGLPQLSNVLIPRTRGFVFIIQRLEQSLKAIYDLTIAYDGAPFSLRDLMLRGRFLTRSLHMHFERLDASSLKALSEDELENVLYDMFKKKDTKLEQFFDRGYFSGDVVNPKLDYFFLTIRFLLWALFISFLTCSFVSRNVGYVFLFLSIISTIVAYMRVRDQGNREPQKTIESMIKSELHLSRELDAISATNHVKSS